MISLQFKACVEKNARELMETVAQLERICTAIDTNETLRCLKLDLESSTLGGSSQVV